MMVAALHVIRVAIDELKAYTPLIVDGDGGLAFAISLECVEAIAGRHLQVVRTRGEVDILQFACRASGDVRGQPLRRPRDEQFPGTLVRERLDDRSRHNVSRDA